MLEMTAVREGGYIHLQADLLAVAPGGSYNSLATFVLGRAQFPFSPE